MCLVALFSVGIANAQTPKKGEKKTVTVEFVTDIDCAGCAKKVTNTIPYEKGVKDVKVDVPTKTVTVTFDPAKTNEQALTKAFEKIKIKVTETAALFKFSGGDARKLLNILDIIAGASDGDFEITDQYVTDCLQQNIALYDKNGEQHYDVISAFIKSSQLHYR